MTTDTSASDPRVVTCPTVEFEMTAQRIEDYALAIGDPNPRFRRIGRDDADVVAPPALAAAYLQQPVRRLFADAERLAAAGIAGGRVVFGEASYVYDDLARPGDWLTIVGHLVGRERKGSKEILQFETTARRDDGTVVATASITLVRV